MIATVKVDENPVALYVRKFRSVCDMHSVRFGSAHSLGAFMRQLAEDRKFAMDFWALAGRFSIREGGPLSDEQMLEVIVREIAGCAVTTADGSLKQQIDDLARMLAGEDVQSPVVHDDVAEDAFLSHAELKPPVHEIPSRPIPSSQPSPSLEREKQTPEPALTSPPILEVDERVEDQMTGALDDYGLHPEAAGLTQHQLDEALLRLELNSLELKLHLDNIDSRMSRMEPHIEELASRVSAVRESGPQQPVREPIREPVHENVRPIQESVGRAVEKSRLVLEPQPVRNSVEDNVEDNDDPSIPVPLEGYSQRRFSRSAGLFAALLLVGVGGFFFLHRQYGASMWQDFGPSLKERYDAALHELHGVMKGHATDESNSAESGPVAPNNGSQAQAMPVTSAAAEQSTNETAKAVTESQAAGSSVDVHPKHKNHIVAASADREVVETSKGVLAGGDLEAPVSVSPVVMEENLVVSRVPAYPEVARADRVEGPVVMQAIISKNGTVGHLHVIQGDPMLRSAASEAVSKWRYRPYTVNGRPVEVATTVTVDFKLNR